MRATKAIIHLDNLTHNIEVVKQHIVRVDKTTPRICMPVKADAYGHGAIPIAEAALAAGVSCLAVATVDEGVELRDAGIKAPVLLFSEALPAELEAACEHRLVPFVSDQEYAQKIAEAAKKIGTPDYPVFVKIDTGMGRLGCRPEDAASLAAAIVGTGALRIAGIATHLAVSDSSAPDNIAYTHGQIAAFKQAVDSIRAAGLNPGIVSASNTGATVSYPEAHFDLVRPGILLYGYQDAEIAPALDVKPVMELVTQVVHIKPIRAGESVSYGRTWTAPRDTLVGVLPIGYADGLPRLLSGRGFFVVSKGKKYPLAGRVCMDQCMVDLGPTTDVARYDPVTVFGGVDGALDAGGVASLIGTISYDFTCGSSKRVPRVYQES
jgi:alanine racemase